MPEEEVIIQQTGAFDADRFVPAIYMRRKRSAFMRNFRMRVKRLNRTARCYRSPSRIMPCAITASERWFNGKTAAKQHIVIV
jgi:hypothetical protein